MLSVFVLCVSLMSFASPVMAEEPDSRPSLTRNKDREARARQGDFMTDEEGRTFRVAFPLYERFFLEGQTGLLPQDVEASTRSPRNLGGRVALVKSFALDFAEEDIWWMMRHRFLDTTYATRGEGSATLHGTLVDAQYLRHDVSSFIIVPSFDDLRLPADFDIATDYQIIDMELSRSKGAEGLSWSVDQLHIARIAVLMDFVRDEAYRHRFAVGVASFYRLTREHDTWHHEISPLTSAKVLYGWDQRDGLFHAYAEAVCGVSLRFEPSDTSTGSGGGEGAARRAPSWSGRSRRSPIAR